MKERIFKEVSSPNVAQWLGFLAADGSVHENRLQIGLSSKDREHLEKFKRFLDAEQEVKDKFNCCNGKYYPTSYIALGSVLMVSDLKQYQIVENKSQIDIDFLSFIPELYKVDFIIGYFDGDGWYTYTDKNLKFGFCGNYNTMNSINNWLYQNLDIKINILQDHKSKITFNLCTSNKIYIKKFVDLYISKKQELDLLQRKLQIALEIKEKLNFYFNKDLKELEKEKVQIKHLPIKECPICKKAFLPNFEEQIFCSQECSHKDQQKVERPDREKLKKLIRTTSFLQLGKQFGVSDNAIRKWCKAYKLPFKKSEINNYSNEEWEKI